MKHGKKFFVGGLLNLGAGLGTAAYGAYQENQAKKKMAQADALAEGPIRSQAARQRIAQQESDAQSAIDSTLRAQATAAEQIAQQGGSRGLVSATPGLIRATDLASQNAIDQFGQRNAAIRRAEESAALGTQRADATANMDRLARAADAARKTTMAGIGQSLAGVAEIAGDYVNKKQDKTGGSEIDFEAKVEMPDPGGGRSTLMDDSTVVVDYDGDATPFKTDGSIVENKLNAASDQALRPRDQMIFFEDELNRPQSALSPSEQAAVDAYENANRSIVATGYARGGEVEEPVDKTPGEFDHDDNPIDIMQEGAKIGEMTGGEYIFNPEQAAEMRKLSEEGDSELHQFIRNLLSKEQFQ